MSTNVNCPNCGHPSLRIRYRSEKSPRPGREVRCIRCGWKDASNRGSLARIRYKVSGKVMTVPQVKARHLVNNGNAVYV